MPGSNESSARFLDSGQYSVESIRRYERVYGRDFISPGGVETAREFVAALRLKPGERVLDAGCGLGGAAFIMAQEHGATVEGIDLSKNMIEMASKRCRALNLEDRVSFRHGDLMALDTERRFDAIYSRDVFLHVADKPALFGVLLRALKPRGRLLITDYCRGGGEPTAAFESYVRARGYFLITVEDYGRMLREAGFENVRATDLSERFAEIHTRELERLERCGQADGDLADLAASWREKRGRALGGEQRWGLFTAARPA